jgi:hypothetical protein
MISIIKYRIPTWQDNLANSFPTFMNIKINNFDTNFFHFRIQIVHLHLLIWSKRPIGRKWLNICFYNSISIIHFFGVIKISPLFESCYRYIDSILCTFFHILYERLNILKKLLMLRNSFSRDTLINSIFFPKVNN